MLGATLVDQVEDGESVLGRVRRFEQLQVEVDEPGPRTLLLEAFGADVEPRRGRRRWPLAAPFAAGSLLIDPAELVIVTR